MKKSSYDLEHLHELHRSGLLDDARTGYLEFLKKNPREVTAIHALGIISAQKKNFSEAIEYLQEAVSLRPQDEALYLHLANALKNQGLFNQAILTLKKALEIKPNYTLAMNNLGTVYYALGKLDDAILMYQQALEAEPHYIDAYYNLGLAFARQENFSDAEQTFEKLLTLAPEHFAARFHFACLLLQQEKFSEALTQFLNIELHHPHHFETQTNLASCYLRLGKYNEAKSHYSKALELMPDDTQILFNLGVINMQLGHVDSAIQYYQRALKINPDYFAAHNNIAIAFLAKQHSVFALQHFQEALRIQPNNSAIQYTVSVLSKHQHLLTAPPDYVQSLFDAYADHYESHLLTALDYQVPALLFDVISNFVPTKSQFDILDLGCGTGLCGSVFKPMAKTLVGVDLSPNMLTEARKKNIYHELVVDNLENFLKNKSCAYDLIVAGDVFVYIGDLAAIFADAKTALRADGFLIFNAEINSDADFKMNQSGRFSHQKNYLDALAQSHGFKIISYKTAPTRMQNNEPVLGHVYLLQARC